VSRENQDGTACIVLPPSQVYSSSQLIGASKCKRMVIPNANFHQIYSVIMSNLHLYTQTDGYGVVCLVYSCLLTKGARNVAQEMDMETSKMMTEHGYAT
jgi:hypothetical protein